MRLKSFSVENAGPIKKVNVNDLADVVVLAGPNGVGKTNVINGILTLARNPKPQNSWMIIEATEESERAAWGKNLLDTRVPEDANKLRQRLQRNQRRNRYQGSFLNFDSDRAVRNIQSYAFSWDIGDPYSEEIGWDIGFGQLSNRYNDVRHSLFRIVESQRREIAEQAIKLQTSGTKSMSLDFPDVLKPFKDAFWQLLAPKRLLEVNVKDQQIYYEVDGKKLALETLSSGEREVINVVFDFILRGPSHCVVVFDEPELHLHPELSYKLLQTLSTIGARNQFIFSTHSPEIISASLENTVVFVRPRSGDENQAVVVHRDDDTHHALQTLGQSIGVISLGKKLVLVEGEEASLDKLTYGAILKNRFPELVLVPVGSKDRLRSFEDVRDNILNKTIWGVEFFLLCDRDAAHTLGKKLVATEQSGRIHQLPRYHLENYFLSADVIAKIFESLEQQGSWLRDTNRIEEKLREIALSVVPYATALNVSALVRERVGNISLMPKGITGNLSPDELRALIVARAKAEAERVNANLDQNEVSAITVAEYDRLRSMVVSGSPEWKVDVPGRTVLQKFSALTGMQIGRLKQAYLTHADQDTTFKEIIDIFRSFQVHSGQAPQAPMKPAAPNPVPA